jgi:hypothetical protein
VERRRVFPAPAPSGFIEIAFRAVRIKRDENPVDRHIEQPPERGFSLAVDKPKTTPDKRSYAHGTRTLAPART